MSAPYHAPGAAATGGQLLRALAWALICSLACWLALPGAALAQAPAPCGPAVLRGPLALSDAVEHALCNNPQTRQAWAEVKFRQAQVDVQAAAYLPNLTATASAVNANADFIQASDGTRYQSRTSSRAYGLNLDWTLFDFGLRDAQVDAARQALTAAAAAQDETIQAVFMQVAQAYYDLLSLQGALAASIEAEHAANESFMAAEAKYDAGAGALADKLQARTTLAQAALDTVRAGGALEIARGAFLQALGMAVDTPFTLAADQAAAPGAGYAESIGAMLETAKRAHPTLVAAQAQVRAAEANVRAAKAALWPQISLSAGLSRDNTSQATSHLSNNSSVGVRIAVPLFDGFGKRAAIRSVRAQLAARQADLAKAELDIAFEVWSSYQTLATETRNLQMSDELSDSAEQSFRIAQGRYKAGVGNILELLNAQSALAGARQQRLHALSGWRTARLRLAAGLGKLGFWALR
ncbi:MAG: TolC family protein [Duganella sp.]